MTQPDQIDIAGARWRIALLFLGAIGFVAAAGVMLHLRPDNGRYSVAPGTFGEFILYICIAFFGLCAVAILPMLLRSGPAVSVGPRGLFDRGLSRDWIPWEAIRDVGVRQMGSNAWVTVALDPAREPDLGIRPMAKLVARMNSGGGERRYFIATNALKGGLEGLIAAIAAKRPR